MKIRICETFESIQGEGRYAGYPALFIRVSLCNLNCYFCDSKYFVEGEWKNIEDVIALINKSNKNIVIWTGGEPTLYLNQINYIANKTRNKQHHIETNGTNHNVDLILNTFDYITISPKKIEDAKFWHDFLKKNKNLTNKISIKVVWDGENLYKDMLKYATEIMPLTTFNQNKDNEIAKKVWYYCVKKNIKFSPRLHITIFGIKRGV